MSNQLRRCSELEKSCYKLTLHFPMAKSISTERKCQIYLDTCTFRQLDLTAKPAQSNTHRVTPAAANKSGRKRHVPVGGTFPQLAWREVISAKWVGGR
jgi:hypothetical protein